MHRLPQAEQVKFRAYFDKQIANFTCHLPRALGETIFKICLDSYVEGVNRDPPKQYYIGQRVIYDNSVIVVITNFSYKGSAVECINYSCSAGEGVDAPHHFKPLPGGQL
jgi:hypothetical protein